MSKCCLAGPCGVNEGNEVLLKLDTWMAWIPWIPWICQLLEALEPHAVRLSRKLKARRRSAFPEFANKRKHTMVYDLY